MADNVLRGTIKIDAPGVQKTFDDVSTGVSNIQKNLAGVPAAANQSTEAIKNAFSSVTGLEVPPIQVKAEVEKVDVPNIDSQPIKVPVVVDTETAKVSLDNLGKFIKPLGIKLDTGDLNNKLTTTHSYLEDLHQQLETFRKALKLATNPNDIEILTKGIKAVHTQIRQVESAGNPLKGAEAGARQAERSFAGLDNVMRSFSQGEHSIESAVESFAESFIRLRTETGSTTGAFSTLLKEFAGGGGALIGLGVILPTVLGLVGDLGEKMFSSGESAKSQAEKLKEAKEALDKYVDGLDDVDKALVKGKQGAQDELVKLQTLYKATQDANIPLAERKKLVDQLQEQYPKYFKNISDETILAGGATKAYNELSTAILASAKARAEQDVLVDIQKQLLAVDQEIAGNAANRLKTEQQINKIKQSPITTTSATGEERLTTAGAQLNKVTGQLNSLTSAGNDLLKQRNDLLSRANVLSQSISKTVEQNPEALLDPTKGLPKEKKPKFEKVNFFDEFLDFDPRKVKAETEDAVKSFTIFTKFALENKGRLIGLDEIFKIDETKGRVEAIKAAADWWAEYSKAWKAGNAIAFYKLVPSLDIKPKIKFDEKEAEARLDEAGKELSKKKIDVTPTITVKVNKGLIDDYNDFKSVGEKIGRSIGNGFDETFKKIFDKAFVGAIQSGLQGKELENFKSEFAAISVVAGQGIQGIANSFTSLTAALLDGKNGMQAFGEAIKGVFRSIALEIVKDIVLAGILSALSGGSSGGGVSFIGALGKILGGSHKAGLKRVPYDGYIAETHKDEMIVPAPQAENLRKIMGAGFSIPGFKNLGESLGTKPTPLNTVQGSNSTPTTVSGIQIPSLNISRIAPINIPAINSTNFSRINNASNLSLSNDSTKSIEVNVSGQLTARGDHMVAVINKTNRNQSKTV